MAQRKSGSSGGGYGGTSNSSESSGDPRYDQMSLSELQSYFGSGVSEVRRYYDAGRWKYTVYGKGEKGERISFFADEPHNIHLTDQAYPPGDPRRHPFGKKG